MCSSFEVPRIHCHAHSSEDCNYDSTENWTFRYFLPRSRVNIGENFYTSSESPCFKIQNKVSKHRQTNLI